jgi:hypothetical protein
VVKNRAAYQRGYNRAWKQARRDRLIEMLGGKCVRCGATEDLEFDHIDPSTKVFAVSAGLSRAWDALVEEASKCQLLCKPCHVAKGAEDRPELKHGTYHVYWYWNCRCDLCKAANARKSADLRAKKLARKFDLPDGGSGGETRTPNQPVNSRLLCRLSYPRLSFPWVFGDWSHFVPYGNALTCIVTLIRASRPETCRLTAGRSAD